jgi:cytidylate kinase
MSNKVPLITIDGPSSSGKGTISHLLAHQLGWHLLDSGVLYRVLALAARQHTIELDNEEALYLLALELNAQFVAKEVGSPPRIILENDDITEDIRSENCGNAASKVAALPMVRKALLERQRAFFKPPGLVADGRDMGSVVFPEADLKIFLIASFEERCQRRYRQLQQKGINVSLAGVSQELKIRDERDKSRAIAPMKPASDAIIIDTTSLSIEQVVKMILAKLKEYLVCSS